MSRPRTSAGLSEERKGRRRGREGEGEEGEGEGEQEGEQELSVTVGDRQWQFIGDDECLDCVLLVALCCDLNAGRRCGAEGGLATCIESSSSGTMTGMQPMSPMKPATTHPLAPQRPVSDGRERQSGRREGHWPCCSSAPHRSAGSPPPRLPCPARRPKASKSDGCNQAENSAQLQ